MIEEWKKYDDRYSVSSFGRVRNDITNHILKGHRITKGYLTVEMSRGRKEKRKIPLIHTLVAELFIGPKSLGMQVNHKNGNKEDNRVVNLEYVTASENMRHSIKNGFSNTLVKPEIVLLIVDFGNTYLHPSQICKFVGVSKGTIGKILRGEAYSEVTGLLKGTIPPWERRLIEIAKKVRELKKSGINQNNISRILGVNYVTVSDICRGRTWKNVVVV